MGETTEQLITQATQYPDYVVVGAIFGLFALYGFVRGTKAISEFAIALLVVVFVYILIPFDLSWSDPAIFVVLSILSAWVLARDTSGLDDDSDIHKVAMAAAGATGILLVISAGMVDFTGIYTFGTPIAGILADASYKFYITVVSLILIALSRKV